MVDISNEDFELFAQIARKHGVDEGMRRISGWKADPDVMQALADEYRRRATAAENGYPPKIFSVPHGEPWYHGPLADDVAWPALRRFLVEEKSWPDDRVNVLDEASTKVVAYTANPEKPAWNTKGLVVGYVQSGKTTNFTSVIAKAVDLGYNLVVVMSGIHNGLRKQTQERLEEQLCELNENVWLKMTTQISDFQKPTMPLSSLLPAQESPKAVLCVVKKNAAVLRKFYKWLERANHTGSLRGVKALIIDDEADQASVETGRINPLVRKIVNVLPACTFLGYTATPFANVLIDPSQDDLYPRDFILNLPRPEGYFGTEMIFGRDEVEGVGDDGLPVDGYDMVRLVTDEEAASLRPPKSGPFEPELTASLEAAVRWFWLATAARRARGDSGHSSMLVHTSMMTKVHDAFKAPLAAFRDDVSRRLGSHDPAQIERFEKIWLTETSKVPAAAFGLETLPFDRVLAELGAVVSVSRVVVDNSTSVDRLDYSSGPVVAIAIGGNTLSRGLTLEGLISSYFVRAASAYDTLLQMGRWFGFRPGYEDLPRIWMTKELRLWFRHLATVEHDLRADIERYEQQGLTPMEFGVRIRTHPTLLVTTKMGQARAAFTSYGGRRVQTRYFHENDGDWLRANLRTADTLVTDLMLRGYARHTRSDGSEVWADVEVAHIKRFLAEYNVHGDSPDLNRELLLAYIDNELEHGSLGRWSVALMCGPSAGGNVVRLGGAPWGRIARSKLRDTGLDRADIKTLMTKEHRVADLDIDGSEARRKPEAELERVRNAHPTLRKQGLLLLYPIDPKSQPDPKNFDTREALAAEADVIGLGLVFPGNADRSVMNSYVSVDLSVVVEPPDDEAGDPVEQDLEDTSG